MDTARPTSGFKAAAKAQQSDPQSDLEALSSKARSIVRRAGWLARDEYLERLDQLLADRPARLSQLGLIESEYRQTRDERIREKTEARPFRSPTLDEKVHLYRQVLEALEACAASLIQPAVLNDPRLEAPHRELIQKCRTSSKREGRHALGLAYAGTKEWAKHYREAINADPHWGRALTSLHDYLQRLEQERDRLKAI